MFTPPKAVPVTIRALTLAFAAAVAQAENKAIWTEKNGWNTEPACVRSNESVPRPHGPTPFRFELRAHGNMAASTVPAAVMTRSTSSVSLTGSPALMNCARYEADSGRTPRRQHTTKATDSASTS